MNRLAMLAALALAGCAPTDTGNPPAALDPSDLTADVMSGVIEFSFSVRGAPGAVEPAEGEVWVLDLDAPREVVRLPVMADGSFAGEGLGAQDGGRVRLWVEAPAGRSAPLDRVVSLGGLVAPDDALDACVRLDPPFALDLGSVAEGETARAALRIENGCGEAIRLAPIAVRDPAIGFEVVSAPDTLLDPGEGTTVEIAVRGAGLRVDALDVESTAPRAGRRAVTLIASPR